LRECRSPQFLSLCSMARTPAIERVRGDLDDGRLWKARDRLHGMLQANPADQEILELLGGVYFKMGDLPQAGRYWYLTERKGSDVDQAMEAFEQRFGRSTVSAVLALPIRARIIDYPEAVQKRVETLTGALRKDERGLRHGSHTGWVGDQKPAPSPPKKILWKAGSVLIVILALAATVGIWLFGIAALFDLI